MVQQPPQPWAEREEIVVREAADPIVEWCREADAILKREKQEVTEEQIRSMQLFKGGTPWWKKRPNWKIGSRFNFCFWVPQKWTQVLCDSASTISYSAYDRKDQRIADIATAALKQAAEDGEWDAIKRKAVLNSRIQKKSFLRLTPDLTPGAKNKAVLTFVSGDQLWVNRHAQNIDNAEVIEYEYPLSLNEVFARWPKLREQIRRKHADELGYGDKGNRGDVLSPSTSMLLPNGNTVNNPPYSAQNNPPAGAGSSAGVMVREFWTFPRKTIDVPRPKFSVAGEPVTRPKMYVDKNGKEEPMRRVITEGGVIYEWPQSYVDIVADLMPRGGLQIIKDMEAVECVKEDVPYRLYPDGRLTIIVDTEFLAENRMNPLGYTPFIEIEAYASTEFWGQSDNDIIGDAYEYYIRLLCSLLDAANLTSNPIWRIPLSSEISDDDITNAPGAIQREDLQMLRYGKREPGPDMPPYVLNLLDKVEDKIMKLSNLNEIATGQAKFKGQQSAETVGMYQDQAAVSFRDALGSIQRADVKLGKQFLMLVSRYFTTPHLVSLKSDAGVNEEIPFLGTHFTTPMRVQAKVGNSMPNSPTARLNMALNMLQSGVPVVDLPEIWGLLEEVGYINSASALERRIEKEMADPKQAWKVPGRPGAQTNTKPKAKKANGKRSNKRQG